MPASHTGDPKAEGEQAAMPRSSPEKCLVIAIGEATHTRDEGFFLEA